MDPELLTHTDLLIRVLAWIIGIQLVTIGTLAGAIVCLWRAGEQKTRGFIEAMKAQETLVRLVENLTLRNTP